MRQVDDAHDAVDEAQARGDQKQHRRVEQRIEHLDDEDRRRHYRLTRVDRWSSRSSHPLSQFVSKAMLPIGGSMRVAVGEDSQRRAV